MKLEGVLWKWTNYWNGWQSRWFILDNGILTYYQNADVVAQGCKGSVKLSACEIIVHPTDPNRLDLVIPSEQHYYLRAASPQERQKWLVAMGSVKSAQGKTDKEGNPDVLKTKQTELRLYCDALMQQVNAMKSAVGTPEQPNVEKMSEASSLLSATCDAFIATLEESMRLATANLALIGPQTNCSFDNAVITRQAVTGPRRLSHKTENNSHER